MISIFTQTSLDWGKGVSCFLMFLLPFFSDFANAQEIREPDQPRQAYNQILYQIGAGHSVQAMTKLKKIIERFPSESAAYSKLAALFAREKESKTGIRYFKSLLKRNPRNASAYLGLGMIFFKKKAYLQSAQEYRQAFERNPSEARSFEGYLNAMQKLGKLQEAAETLGSIGNTRARTAAYFYALGYLNRLQKKWAQGLANLNRALALDANLFEAYTEKGVILYFEGGYSAFLKTSEVAFNQAMKADNPEAQCHFLGNIGLAYFSMGNFSRALDFNNRALKLAQKIGSENEAIRILNNLGTTNRNLGKMDAALGNFKEALKLARNLGDRRQEGLLLRNSGSVYRLKDEYREALVYFNRSLPILHETGEKRREGLVYWSLSLTHWNFGNYPRALSLCKKALAIARESGDTWGLERYGGTIGLIYWNLGQYAPALDAYEKALKLARQIGDKAGEELWLGNRAILFDELGDSEKAEEDYEMALAIAKKTKDRRAEGREIGNLAAHYKQSGQLQKALSAYCQALKIEEEIWNRKDQIPFLNAIALLSFHLRGGNASREKAQKALRISREIGSKKLTGHSYLTLGELNDSAKKYELARENFTRALQMAREMHNADLLWRAHAGLARVYSRLGRCKNALSHSRKAIRAIEEIRATVPTDEYKTGFFETKMQVYDQAIHTLTELHRRFPLDANDKEAFELAERARARSLLDMLYRGRVFQILKDIPPGFRERFLINEKQLNNAHQSFSDELAKPKDQQNQLFISRISGRIDSLNRAKAHLTRALQEKFPRYYQLTNPVLPTVRDVQTKMLGQKQILIEFWIGEGQTYLWAISKKELRFKTIPLSREELRQKLEQISPLFGQQNVSRAVSMDHRWANINPQLLNRLYLELLGKPLGHFLEKADELIIIPDGLLFYLPFEILVMGRGKNAAHYLVEDYAISYTPSASLRLSGFEKNNLAPRGLLALGNPDFSSRKKNVSAAQIDLLGRYFSARQKSHLRRLPSAAREVKVIAKTLGRATVLTGKSATEGQFKRLAGSYQLIHLATHFQIDDAHPMYSRIFLASSENGSEDGKLQTYEIYNLRLHADLVVLSGCNSGLGKLSRGEGLIGLTGAFLYAGAPRVIVSLWPVEDQSTAELMKNFYLSLNNGFTKARALQKAKIDLIQSKGKIRNPFYWAPFILIEE